MSYATARTEIFSLYSDSTDDKKELDALDRILPLIEDKLTGKYEIVGKIAKAGTGLVLQVKDLNLKVIRAMKCARPLAGREPILTTLLASEISKLRGVSHQNIVTLFYSDSIQYADYEWPFYIMEFVEGGTDFLKYLSENKQEERKLILMLREFVEGCLYLHSQKMIHGDIKLENALVTLMGHVKISDLGSARYLSDENEQTMLVFSRPWAHPTVLRGAIGTSDPNRARRPAVRNELNFWVDLYPLGKNIIRILDMIDPSDTVAISPYTRAYLHLMAARLLDGYNEAEDELPLGIPKPAFGQLKYTSLENVVDDLKKLTGEYPLTADVPELDEHYPNKIQCSFPRACAFTSRVENLVKLPIFQRLGETSQLGMVVFIYPTATHNRLEHSLGTYAMAVRYCNALWNDPINPFFKQLMTPRHLKTVLCAALCHDIGQYGLAHDFEEAGKSSISNGGRETSDGKNVFDHVEMTVKVLKGGIPAFEALRGVLINEWDIDPNAIERVLTVKPTDLSQPILERLLHTIISGPVDVDKADYLIRDAKKLGVSYGDGIDLERLINCLTVTFETRDSQFYVAIGVNENGKIAAESLAFTRYAMFGSVYWHHTSRSLKSMLHRAIWEAMPARTDYVEWDSFEQQFENFALNALVRKGQLSLFRFEDVDLQLAPQLSPGDLRILQWLYEKTSDPGKKLVSMILARSVFKRHTVISHAKDEVLWHTLQEIRNEFRDFKRYVRFQQLLQKHLIEHIEEADLNALVEDKKMHLRGHMLLPEEIGDIKNRHGSKEILVIVDIPNERPGSSIELRYLTEARIQGRRQIGDVASLEDSIVWEAINKKFVESVGKIRIFVHPQFAKYFEVICSREMLRKDLVKARDEVRLEIKKGLF